MVKNKIIRKSITYLHQLLKLTYVIEQIIIMYIYISRQSSKWRARCTKKERMPLTFPRYPIAKSIILRFHQIVEALCVMHYALSTHSLYNIIYVIHGAPLWTCVATRKSTFQVHHTLQNFKILKTSCLYTIFRKFWYIHKSII